MKWQAFFAACCLALAGCSDKPSPVEPPAVYEGHAVVRPAAKSAYRFINSASSLMKPAESPDGVSKAEGFLLQATIWNSTCSGLLSMNFKGYFPDEVFAAPLATYEYELKDLQFRESTQIQNGDQWEEIYGDAEDSVKMSMNGRPRSRADMMNDMIGEPREWFLYKDSKAKFLPNGRAARWPADVMQCQSCSRRTLAKAGSTSCSYCQGQLRKTHARGELAEKAHTMNASALMGQYFFKGIRVEELAHRMAAMTPPLAALKNAVAPVSWMEEAYLPVVPKEAKDPLPRVNWTCQGLKEAEGRKVLVLQFTLRQVVQEGTMLHNGEIIQGWAYDLRGNAELDPNTLEALKIRIEEDATWVDFIPYQRLNQSARHQMVIMQVTNAFTITRQT